MKPLPELMSFLEGLPEPHILFDTHYRILAANAAYRHQFSPEHSVVGRTCYEVSHHFNTPCDQAGETCPLVQARASGQRERVLHLHHTAKGQEYVTIELAPLLDAAGTQAFYIEKMQALPMAQGRSNAVELIGRSPTFQHMLALVSRVAPSAATVLLLGESGTGKELVARSVHEASSRADHALVPVDCSSLSENLFESELFGHERGAFTGASSSKTGLVEAASGGTLFLDEVGDIPLSMQVKLLRLLETGTYRRVGSTELRHADIRVVAATHRDLTQLVHQGLFRQDLYYRLSIFPIQLPALRERVPDITLLATALLTRVAPQRRLLLSDTALQMLAQHDYPGNVRELRNLLERAALLCDGDTLQANHIDQALRFGQRPACSPQANTQAGFMAAGPYNPDSNLATTRPASGDTLKKREQETLQALVDTHTGSRAELAARLGISERSLYRKLRRLQTARQGAIISA